MQADLTWLQDWVTIQDPLAVFAQMTDLGLELESFDPKSQAFEFSVTPNRGDCLSVLGLAREAALAQGLPIPAAPALQKITASFETKVRLDIDPTIATQYYGCSLKGVNNQKPTPAFIQQRLAVAGLRSVSLVVDVLNYVLVELGQPMHAFAAAGVGDTLTIRAAMAAETVVLLDGKTYTLEAGMPVITNSKEIIALAGVMGSESSKALPETQDFFLESANFSMKAIGGVGRKLQLHTDGGMRFERGVDPALAPIALARAVALILEHGGGEAGSVVSHSTPIVAHTIAITPTKVNRILGTKFTTKDLERLLQKLNFGCVTKDEGCTVTIPSYRTDVRMPIDLVEEFARVEGINNLPVTLPQVPCALTTISQYRLSDLDFKERCVDLALQEVMTYSFSQNSIQSPVVTHDALPLLNPLAQGMSVMRASLLPGMLSAVHDNQVRQHARLRFFEVGTVFLPEGNLWREERQLAIVLSGAAEPPQWMSPERKVDFFDIKGIVSQVLGLTRGVFSFVTDDLAPWIYPGQGARILDSQGRCVGQVGVMAPQHLNDAEVKGPVVAAVLTLDVLKDKVDSPFHGVRRFPSMQRDLALIVPRSVSYGALQADMVRQLGDLCTDVVLFDLYQGAGLPEDTRSLALRLNFNHPARTLQETEVEEKITALLQYLEQTHQVVLRQAVTV